MRRLLGAFAVAAACAALACSPSYDGAAGGDDDPSGGKDDSTGGAVDPAPLRFVAVGDTGKANDVQYQVAAAIRDQCAAEGCDFVLLLGDNLYPEGAEDTGDPVWQSAFEDPYRDIDLPFYAVLGNHDYGGKILFADVDGLGNQFERGPVEVAYSDRSAKWRMPDTHYTLRLGPVGFIALDTDSILWNDDRNGDQWAWFPDALAEVADASWVLALGHHPYRSNGDHGNAGDYNILFDLSAPIDALNGEEVEAFIDENVCGNVDLYLSGHDHDRQWLADPSLCAGTELVVSGAGGEVKELDDPERNPVVYQDGSTAGFLYVVADESSLTGRFVDASGAVAFERTLSR
jgi:tartrate-resistant acid phosphatase type 5